MIDFEEALKFADTVVFDTTGNHLSEAQRFVLEGTWDSQTYDKIADAYGYSPRYLKQDVGHKLWKLLSAALGEKVNKKNFRTIVEVQLVDLRPPPTTVALGNGNSRAMAPEVTPVQPRQDWGEAPDVSIFYGRTRELAQLQDWIVSDGCRVVALLGMGGMGKTALSVKLAHQIQGSFEYIIWRSLRNAPPLETILRELMQFLSEGKDSQGEIRVLLEYLRASRCLLILDNMETILQAGRAGEYQRGYEGYGELLRAIGETAHSSCLVLTSREKLAEIAELEGVELFVRTLQLKGSPEAALASIQAKGLSGTALQKQQLCDRYSCSPLALKIVASSIQDLFNGEIGEFLAQNTAIFNSLRKLLDQQFQRLSPLEQTIAYWLAIDREGTTLAELEADLVPSVSKAKLLEALESLNWRSLVESQSGVFTQQPAIVEYILEQFIDRMVEEIETETIDLFMSHAILKAQAQDYIRESQINLILKPIVQQLCHTFRIKSELERKLQKILLKIRQEFGNSPGYGAGNTIDLCHQLQFDLSGYDFSHLTVWQAYLQDANLQNVNFSGADLSKSIFAKPLGDALVVALGRGNKLATGDAEGKILLWQVTDGQQLLACQGQTGALSALAFDPHGTTLASGSDNGTLKLWEVSTGKCLYTERSHHDRINCISFSHDGRFLASGGNDGTVQLWDLTRRLQTLEGHKAPVQALSFSPDSAILASGSDDQSVRFWEVKGGQCLRTLPVQAFPGNHNRIWAVFFAGTTLETAFIVSSSDEQTVQLRDAKTGECYHSFGGHEGSVWTVTLSPDGQILASSDDRTVKLWNTHRGDCIQTLQGFDAQVCSVAFSPDAPILAAGSMERWVQLWDVSTGRAWRNLRGHRRQVWCFDLSPDGKILATGSDDQMVRLWDANRGQVLKTLSGHRDWVWSVAFAPDGRMLASGSYDKSVKLWTLETGECLKTLLGHDRLVQAVTFSPHGRMLASASDDQTVKLWDISTGECLQTLEGHTRRVGSIAFRGDGQLLASGSHDQTVKLWEVDTGSCLKTLHGHSDRIHTLAFSPDGQTLVTSSDDQTVKLWQIPTGKLLYECSSPAEQVHALFFGRDGQLLLCGSHHVGQGMEAIVSLWDLKAGKCLNNLLGLGSPVWSVRDRADGRTLVTGSDDLAIRLWNLETGECFNTIRTDKPYNGMNITGVRGLSAATIATLKALGAMED